MEYLLKIKLIFHQKPDFESIWTLNSKDCKSFHPYATRWCSLCRGRRGSTPTTWTPRRASGGRRTPRWARSATPSTSTCSRSGSDPARGTCRWVESFFWSKNSHSHTFWRGLENKANFRRKMIGLLFENPTLSCFRKRRSGEGWHLSLIFAMNETRYHWYCICTYWFPLWLWNQMHQLFSSFWHPR